MVDICAQEFESRVEKCSQETRQLLDFLKTVAEHAGPDVEAPTFEREGGGITFWTGGKRFCRFDPKHVANHVWAMLPGGDRVALGVAGEVVPREDGPWVTIENMHGAVRLVPQILRAYNAKANGSTKQRQRVG